MNSIDSAGLQILYRDAHLLAVNKPQGIPAQPDRRGDRSLLDQVQAIQPTAKVGSPHRLDRPVSGVTLFTFDDECLPAMDELFRRKQVAKTYLAIVEGPATAPGRLCHRLKHSGGTRKAIAEEVEEGSKGSVALNYVPRALGDRYSLIEVVPSGGAFHQIRAQLAAAGHPIKGDVKYGARRGEPDRSIALHAWRLAFMHPITGAPLVIQAPPPSNSIWPVMLAMPPIGPAVTADPHPPPIAQHGVPAQQKGDR